VLDELTKSIVTSVAPQLLARTGIEMLGGARLARL
jgi:hypothetical protein